MFYDKDIDLFFADFAINAVLHSQGETAFIRIIFKNEYATTAVTEGMAGIAVSDPIAICRTSDVSSVIHGDSLEIGDMSYTITRVQPNGTGFTTLFLSED